MALTALQKQLIGTLSDRFHANAQRHPGVSWESVESRLVSTPGYLQSLLAMESTGGEPDVVLLVEGENQLAFIDCSPESPAGRRSLCFDEMALESRKANKPQGNAVGMALSMGVEILSEELYRYLQTLGQFDLKTSSWVETPQSIRELGGALFGDRRFGQVFIYHNGAESYYAARGFRCALYLN